MLFRSADPAVRALAAKVAYVINPDDDYPRNFSGHIRATLKDGTVREVRQPHMRGGAHEPLSSADIAQKFHDNARFGGWTKERATTVEQALEQIAAGGNVDLSAARA